MKETMRYCILFLLSIGCLFAQDAVNGKRVYTSHGCYQCHGRQAQGSTITGPRLGPRPIAFAAFTRYVRRPTGQMPPYSEKILTDKEMTDIYAFLEALPRPAAVKSIPLLR
jgi:ubiquinol-cytochrome c reductase cytochrome c subunit